jgi:hydroxymethylbilane synthase
MKNKKIIIGSRGSKLALIYAERAKKEIIKNSNIKIEDIEIRKIITDGDKIQNIRLSESGGKGLFSKKIEEDLINKKIDIAVHALKDMPSEETDGLTTDCFLQRNDPREILVSRDNKKIEEIKTNSIIGTSSVRREFQLKKIRQDINYKLIRGNIDTRLKKLNDKSYDAIILSYAGIKCLGLINNITQIFSTSEIIPSVGQGVIALQCRKDDYDLLKLLNKINHNHTCICVTAERNVLKVLEGDCNTAVGANAKITADKISLEAELFSLDGKERFYIKSSKNLKLASELGKEVGAILKKKSKNSYKK